MEAQTVDAGLTDEEKAKMKLWRQGDYTLDVVTFPVLVMDEDGDLIAELDKVAGWIVVSQTCDIVNFVEGRDNIVVAPIVFIDNPRFLEAVEKGTTPAATVIELPAQENHVADLTRLTTVQKKAFVRYERREGFASEESRGRFAQAVERRYGRFAFPDALSDGPILAIRNQAKEKHSKDSVPGRVYRSLRCIRILAKPDFETAGATIQLLAVLDEEAKLEATVEEIREELKKLATAPKFNWPSSFEKDTPFVRVVMPDSLSAREWFSSQQVDLDFISPPKA
ncbi:hypothetical protein [Rhizobium oryzicola]|uniref:Uncharacterized protein n=1 Tax=Rhizobium oryzicola TaxID=1232668 RepID=A0ABT8T4K2_9HYPH|nr:hypothetical protein [Rhizobium oryzicola]MDO1585641.1 hypothetical protein [Rhizobium oryzicola]